MIKARLRQFSTARRNETRRKAKQRPSWTKNWNKDDLQICAKKRHHSHWWKLHVFFLSIIIQKREKTNSNWQFNYLSYHKLNQFSVSVFRQVFDKNEVKLKVMGKDSVDKNSNNGKQAGKRVSPISLSLGTRVETFR